jgi:hypothetical protein
MAWTDERIDAIIAASQAAPDVERALAELDRAREQVTAERGPRDAAVGRLWETLSDLAMRRPEDEPRLRYAEGHATWAVSALDAADPGTLRALANLGDVADEACAWATATHAWEQIVAAPVPEDAAEDDRRRVSRALRGLGARRLAEERLAEALALFERDVALRERLRDGDAGQLALSLRNVASARAASGDVAGALSVEARRLAHLELAYGGEHPLVEEARERIDELREEMTG